MTTDKSALTYDWTTTAEDVIAGIDLAGRRAVVTGGSSGIGAETARVLAQAGAEVTLAVRNPVAGQAVADEVEKEIGRPVRVGQLDLADLQSVRAFAGQWRGPLHILVNNAGIMAVPERRLTRHGWELHFATNHLGHFLLARELHGPLAAAGGARVVALTSRGHMRGQVTFEDIHFERRGYDPYVAYGQSKSANVLFAVAATRRWAEDGIVANAVHPGAIEATRLGRFIPEEHMNAYRSAAIYNWKTPAQGAATSVLVASAPELAAVGGRYFEDCREGEVLPPGTDFAAAGHGVAYWAVDEGHAERLWDVSEQLLGGI